MKWSIASILVLPTVTALFGCSPALSDSENQQNSQALSDQANAAPSDDALLDLATPVDFFKDILDGFVEIPSDLYKRGQIKDFLSTSTAIELRKDLGAFRDEMIAKFFNENKKKRPDYITLSQEITKRYVDWIRKYMKKTLPMGVSENDFALVAFGSMAREEVAGPYTDLEAAILVKNQDKASLFMGTSLAQNMAYWFNQAGEHPNLPMQKKGFRPDEASNFPFNFALHAKNMTNAEAYCMAYKALGPPRPTSKDRKAKDGFLAWQEKKEASVRYYPFEGSWAFITTPQNLASYFKGANFDFPFPLVINEDTKKKGWFQFGKAYLTNPMLKKDYIYHQLTNSSCAKEIGDDKAIATAAGKISDTMVKNELQVLGGFDSIGRNALHLFGNQELFDEFQKEAQRVLDGPDHLREKAMVRVLHGLLLKFRKVGNGGAMFLNGHLPDVTDVKRVLYRFEEQVWTTLGRLYNLPSQNVREILRELASRGIISRQFANKRIGLLNNALGLRWKETILAGGQLSADLNYLSKEKHTEAITKARADDLRLRAKLDRKIASKGEIEKSISTLQASLRNETDANKNTAIRNELTIKMAELRKLAAEQITEVNQIVANENKIAVLKALDPDAPDPAFPKTDIEKWRHRYSKMSQDLYRRLLNFVGGIGNIEKKNYVPENPDAFKDDAVAPEVDVERLMAIE